MCQNERNDNRQLVKARDMNIRLVAIIHKMSSLLGDVAIEGRRQMVPPAILGKCSYYADSQSINDEIKHAAEMASATAARQTLEQVMDEVGI